MRGNICSDIQSVWAEHRMDRGLCALNVRTDIFRIDRNLG